MAENQWYTKIAEIFKKGLKHKKIKPKDLMMGIRYEQMPKITLGWS